MPSGFTRLLLLALAPIMILLGCSYSSVGHLQRQPWVLNTPQELEMRFWKFFFLAESSGGEYVLDGVAEPRVQNLPEGFNWIEDLWLEVYLSDDRGRVLARDLRVFSSLPLQAGVGVRYSFVLKPDQLTRSASLEVTFGYSMTLVSDPTRSVEDTTKTPPANGKNGVFFAHEGALTKN